MSRENRGYPSGYGGTGTGPDLPVIFDIERRENAHFRVKPKTERGVHGADCGGVFIVECVHSHPVKRADYETEGDNRRLDQGQVL